MQFFSSDRTIQEYAEQIWNTQPCSLPSAIEEEEPVIPQISFSQRIESKQQVGSLRRHHIGSQSHEDMNSFTQKFKSSYYQDTEDTVPILL